MRLFLTSVLDALFLLGWLGVLLTMVTLAVVLLSIIIPGAEMRMSEHFGASIGLATLVLWFILGSSMLVHAARMQDRDPTMCRRWLWAIVLNPLIVGPSAYYLMSFRPDVLKRVSGRRQISARQLFVVDVLYYVSSVAVAVFVLSIAGLLLSAGSILLARMAVTIAVISLPVAALAILCFATLLLIDAFSRTATEWQETNFLKFLNPWAWVFGARYYYRNFVRPRSRGQL